MLERPDEEIKRRRKVVRIFPGARSCLRLVLALCAETRESWMEDGVRCPDMDLLQEQRRADLRKLAACVLLRAGVASARGRVQPMRSDPKCGKTNSCLQPRPKCGKRETGAWHARTKLQNNRYATWMDWIRKQLYAGRVDRAAAALKPRLGRSKAVAACIRTCEANRDRMCCDLCRDRGMPIGFGVYGSSRISRVRFWTSLRCATRRRRSRSNGRRIQGGSSPPVGEGAI